MRKTLCICLLFMTTLLVGCGASNDKETQNETKDVEVKDVSGRYYNEQTLLIPINNGYRYTNVVQEFDETTQEYTITVTVYKPIKEN